MVFPHPVEKMCGKSAERRRNVRKIEFLMDLTEKDGGYPSENHNFVGMTKGLRQNVVGLGAEMSQILSHETRDMTKSGGTWRKVIHRVWKSLWIICGELWKRMEKRLEHNEKNNFPHLWKKGGESRDKLSAAC